MKFICPFFLIFVLTSTIQKSFAQSPPWKWAQRAGNTTEDYGQAVTTDANGNLFSTGYFDTTITFGSTTLIGSHDVYIVKHDGNGNVLWAKSTVGSGDDRGTGISTDASGNVFVTGIFSGPTILFGTTTLTNVGGGLEDVFIVKYDVAGNVLWAKSGGGTSKDDANSVSTDASGNVFVTGMFVSPTLTFGTTTLTNSGFNNDVFIVKYDSSGNILWAKSAGGAGEERAYCSSTDANGNVYLSGRFYGFSFIFGSTTLINADTVGSSDVFFAKYDSNGNPLWAKRAGGANSDAANSITGDINGNILLTGYFQSPTITFGSSTLTNSGGFDMFLAKYDSNGNFIWAKRGGGISLDAANSVAVDASGNILVAGVFNGPTITFGSITLSNAGTGSSLDLFLAKYDANGNVLWAKSAGGNSDDEGYSVALGQGGTNIFITGYFWSDSISFGTTTLFNASPGYPDIFIAKLNGSAYSISGTIYKSDNISEITSGKVFLLNYESGATALSFADSFPLNGTSGIYFFSNQFEGNYLLKVRPDTGAFPNTIPTYLGDTAYWEYSTVFGLFSDTAGINISVRETPVFSGNGFISGNIQYGFGTGKTGNGNMIPFGDPVPGIDVSLEQIPGGIKAHTNTDQSGHFSFSNIPMNNTYRLLVDIPGLPMDSTYKISITSNDTVITNLDFVVDTTSASSAIYIGYPLSTKEFTNKNSGIMIYPNPSSGKIAIAGENITSIEIRSLRGELVRRETGMDFRKKIIFDLSAQPLGIYFIHCISNENNVYQKLIISEN